MNETGAAVLRQLHSIPEIIKAVGRAMDAEDIDPQTRDRVVNRLVWGSPTVLRGERDMRDR
jgi:hypothetical protein